MDHKARMASPADAATLNALFRDSFTETFGQLYAAEDLAAFLAGQSEEAWRELLSDRAFAVRLVEVDGVAIAFAKLGPVSLPVEPDRPAIELRQFYILKPWQGSGLAGELMAWILAEARHRDASLLFLSVFIDNHRARRFYARYGFTPVGRYDFKVGNHIDEDIIMRLEIPS